MDKVRGGVFSGAMVLAGLSATLISALIAIGIRQVTHPAIRPTPIYVQPASGEVAVPDATPSSAHAAKRGTVAPQAPATYSVAGPTARHRSATTGSVTSGASVTPAQPAQQPAQQPATASGTGTTPSPSSTSSPSSASPSPSASTNSNGAAKGNGNGGGNAGGNGNGAGGGNGGGNGSGHH